jgi:hypothetical protein
LGVGFWSFSGAWGLMFGAFIRLASRKRAGEIRVRPEQVAEPAD